MAKVNSRTIAYLVVGGVALYAASLYLFPDDSASKPATSAKRTTSSAASKNAGNGVLPEDLNAHFAAYTGPRRNAFLPRIVSTRALSGGAPGMKLLDGGKGSWVLTGITSINGQTSALLENSSAGQSAFVKVGDEFLGQRVETIADGYVTLANGLGQKTQVTFPVPEDPDKKSTVNPTPGSSPVPGQPAGRPVVLPQGVAPAPVPPLPGARN